MVKIGETRITLDLTNDLWTEIKKLAIDEHKHLKDLVVEGISKVLEDRKKKKSDKDIKKS